MLKLSNTLNIILLTMRAVAEHTSREQKLLRSWVRFLPGAGLFFFLSFFPCHSHFIIKRLSFLNQVTLRRLSLRIMRRTKIVLLAELLWAKQALFKLELKKSATLTGSDDVKESRHLT